ncbi:MAG: hypothetical protein N2Z73_01045, partial [Endomicrobia bacterium]|nr:hypothetical protein [Endomicrobiia bacterium]
FNTISRLEQTSKELATIYNISQIMMESVSKMLDVKEFLFKIATEIENILPQFCELLVYIYNIFNEEYELVTYKSEYKKWIKEVYDVNDEIVKMFNTSQEVIIENDRIYIYHLQNTGMILIIMNSQFNLSQQNKNLLNSIANLVSVSATTLKNLQEQKEKLKLESARTKYIF